MNTQLVASYTRQNVFIEIAIRQLSDFNFRFFRFDQEKQKRITGTIGKLV